jgi:hypothetical protein
MYNDCLKVTTQTYRAQSQPNNTHTYTAQSQPNNTHTYRAQSQPNNTDFYQSLLANASIYQNGLVKARNGNVYKLFSNFCHLAVINARMYR